MVRGEKVAKALDVEEGILRKERDRKPPASISVSQMGSQELGRCLALGGDSGRSLHPKCEPLNLSYGKGMFWRM